MPKLLTPILLLSLVLAAALAIYLERTESRTWSERLVLPRFSEEPNRHTPRFAAGKFLPPLIARDLTLTPEDNPIILTKKTTVAPGATLTLQAGTQLYAHEFAALHVEGALATSGTETRPILFTSNELHPANQAWAGIIFHPASRGFLAHIALEHASPAISCLKNSRVQIANSRIQQGALGLYTESKNCTLSHSSLQALRNGIIAVGVEPQTTATSFDVTHEEIIKR